MKDNLLKSGVFAVAVAGVSIAGAEVMDRPTGIKIGERMTLKPYISLGAAYDDNVDSARDGGSDVTWHINPGLSLEYKAENWSLAGNLYYQFNQYSKSHRNGSSSSYSYHSFGQDLTYHWTDSTPGNPGWSLMINERYRRINQVDDMSTNGGYNYNGNRDDFNISGALERRFASGIHGDVNTQYNLIDYEDSGDAYNGCYGWQTWSVGTELGWALSQWTDLMIAGRYHGYRQDNTKNSQAYDVDRGYSRESEGYTIHAGIGSYATEKITYRFMGGISEFRYAGGAHTSDGFTYSAGANWKITDRWDTMLLASSYYQPNEREYAAASRVDSVSWGLAHTMIRGKLSATFDIVYHRETREYDGTGYYDYDLDVATYRLGLRYTINRFVGLFANGEYRMSMPSGSSARGDVYDYDRFRVTVGVRLTY